jgi:hypothetical protein
MKNIKLSLFLLLGVTLVFTSCESDLEVTPTGLNQQTVEQFYAQPDAYKKGLAGVYGNLALTGTNGAESSNLGGIDAGTSQYSRVLWYMQSLSADEAVWSYENDPGVREIQKNIWTASNPIIRGMFSRAMFQVALSNEYLRQTSDGVLSGRGVTDATLLADIKTYRAEARALRALAYYHLMDLYGKAAFVTENDAVGVTGLQYNRQQLFDFIETDLKAILPELKASRTNEVGRLDQGFANMILAKIYLNAEVYIGTNKYQECLDACQAIISGGYTLNTNYKNNFNADNDTSNEMIFSIESSGVTTQNYGATTIIINGQVGSIEANGAQFGVGGFGGALRLRRELVQKFNGSQFNNDSRKNIISGTRSIDIPNVSDRDTGYLLAKFSNISSNNVNGLSTTFVETNYPLFRLADVYLMYAEAQMRKDNSSANNISLGYLNQLRQRANNGTTVANITSADLNYIIDERARELHWEGHRRQDLIRFGRYSGSAYNWQWKGNAVNGIPFSSNLNVFPLPQAALQSNPNLTQNTGY